MAWFDWIGEAIGGAFHALAEFITDGFQGILTGVGSAFKGISTDLMTDLVATANNPSDPLQQGAKTLHEKAVAPIEQGFNHTVAELEKGHSEISPNQAAAEVLTLYDAIRRDSGAALIANIAIECASLGQVEGPMTSYNFADRISGATAFAGQVAAMKYRAQWLTSYERYLNWTNPNKIAGPSDIVLFALREVYDEDRRAEELEETPAMGYYADMLENGFNQTQADNYWAAHWKLPSVGELNEMLHRGVIDLATWDRFVKYNDYDPAVRPWLKAISYNPYTRVDSQRMWSLDLLTEEELKANYLALGYDDVHAQRMTLWTKINVLATELRARYAKGWITPEQVRSELIAEGMPTASVDRWVQRIVKAETAARTDAERTLTKAEIIKGYTKEVIDYPTALQMLIDMGYTSDEAEYILIVNTAVIKEIPPAEPKGLTKSEIIKGFKLNVITQEEALTQLVNLGYTRQTANFLLVIGVPADTTTGG
jgi:hypothetical protein